MSEINKQKEQISSEKNHIRLIDPCTINNGIIPLKDLQTYNRTIGDLADKVSFFIPASGSGSRMFGFLYDFISVKQENELSTLFFRKFRDFPFSAGFEDQLSGDLNSKIVLAETILFDETYRFGDKPKGLIPFFKWNDQLLTPFQVQTLQAETLIGENPTIHFTVQEKYREEIRKHLHVDGTHTNISFSIQDPESDAFCFDEIGNSIMRNGEYLRRPAGHGALLSNLNRIEKEYVLIKNIDNVQAPGDEKTSLDAWKCMVNLLSDFKVKLQSAIEKRDFEVITQLNEMYHFTNEDLSDQLLAELEEKPIRVCGMVKNQGKPGGGPFWVDVDGHVSKQIVELSQVANDPEQKEVVNRSTHFNPVFMVCSLTNLKGRKVNLTHFVNENLYLKVKKQDNGQEVYYRELPGLWNGSMHNWITVFVELPEEVFTPVKTVIDLL